MSIFFLAEDVPFNFDVYAVSCVLDELFALVVAHFQDADSVDLVDVIPVFQASLVSHRIENDLNEKNC